MQRRRRPPGVTPIALAIWLAACSAGGTPPVQSIPPPVASSTASPVLTPSPSVDPTMQPRMDGTYVVVKTVTAIRNFTGIDVGDVLRRTYRVAPSCPIGPCGGSIKINLDETTQNIKRRLSYDEATHAYALVPITSPVICTGVDGRRYPLKDTTDTVVITPVKSAPTLVDVIVTKWTGEEVLRAVPSGPALRRGKCRVTVIRYRYRGTLDSTP